MDFLDSSEDYLTTRLHRRKIDLQDPFRGWGIMFRPNQGWGFFLLPGHLHSFFGSGHNPPPSTASKFPKAEKI